MGEEYSSSGPSLPGHNTLHPLTRIANYLWLSFCGEGKTFEDWYLSGLDLVEFLEQELKEDQSNTKNE